VTVVLNAAPAQALPAQLLDLVDVLVVNEGELATVAGHDGSIADCLARISTPTVVVTLGHHGCCARTNGQFILQPAFKVTPVDTTAAGDTFCGGLVAALAQGGDMAHALRQASAAGALACTQLGAQSSIPQATDVTTFLSTQSTQENPAEIAALRAFCGLK
jgi:ribokinase